MIVPDSNTTADLVVALLIHYSFDRAGYTAGELIDRWLNDYPASWVRLAVIEALYQGRYKAISVEQILAVWNRRGQPLYHFNHEFERLICGNFFQTLSSQPDTTNYSPLVSKADVHSSNGHGNPPIVMTQESGGKDTPDQFVDTIANTPPSSNQMSEEPTQKKRHQPSVNSYRPLSHSSTCYSPIEQFTPDKTDGSDFYIKLKSIAQHPE